MQRWRGGHWQEAGGHLEAGQAGDLCIARADDGAQDSELQPGFIIGLDEWGEPRGRTR